jgi:hypothetical protein
MINTQVPDNDDVLTIMRGCILAGAFGSRQSPVETVILTFIDNGTAVRRGIESL